MKRISMLVKCLVWWLVLLSIFLLESRVAAQAWIDVKPTGGPLAARGADVAVYDAAVNSMSIFAVVDSPWPMLAHDERHTGLSPFNGPAEIPSRLWFVQISNGGGVGSPVIGASGVIYIAGGFRSPNPGLDGAFLYAVRQDGSLKWKIKLGGAGGEVLSTPAVSIDETIYLATLESNQASGTGYFAYLNAVAADGTLSWRFNLGEGLPPSVSGRLKSSPTIAPDGTILIGADNASLYAINPVGTLRWRRFLASSTESSPAVGDETVYVLSAGTVLSAFSLTGIKKFDRFFEPCGTSIGSASPSIGFDSTIYFAIHRCDLSRSSDLVAFNQDRSIKWRVPLNGSAVAPPTVVMNGTIYLISALNNKATLNAINPDGSSKWTLDLPGPLWPFIPVIADASGILYLTGPGILAINPDGTIRWHLTVGISTNSSPAVDANGRIYIAEGLFLAISGFRNGENVI